ncbi:MAG: MBL fold metallo-hydrolase, partial [Deltaproteobacteria bacterium]
TKVADGIYLSEGLSNSFLIVTGAGRIVINTGMAFEAPVHKRNFDAVDSSPVRYIVLTQSHVDHVGGVELFRQEGTEVVAQAGSVAFQTEDAMLRPFRSSRSSFAFADAIERWARHAKDLGGPAAPTQPVVEPTITFDNFYRFELGGTALELLAVPGGETTESCVVWLPDRRICLTGNLFSALFGHFPNLATIRGDRYRDALRFIDSLERVRRLHPALLLVGHHGPVEGEDLIQAELGRLRDAVAYVHEKTVEGMNAGKSLYEVMREVRLPPELEVGEGYGKVSWGVRAIWENYTGWFQQRSTTELYAVPYWSVHAELVELAGGPDVVVRRARARLDAGEPLEAIHLAEAALAAAPAHAGALGVLIAAHEALLAESANFWEASWLEFQIRRLRAALEQAEKQS